MVLYIVCAVIGVLCGFIFAMLFHRSKEIGTLRLDRSIPDEPPYLFLELDPDGMSRISRHKTVTLRVRTDNYLPRN